MRKFVAGFVSRLMFASYLALAGDGPRLVGDDGWLIFWEMKSNDKTLCSGPWVSHGKHEIECE
jgi:hypothetical protein